MGQECYPSVCFPLQKAKLYKRRLEGLKMEEYTRKHLNESVYPFVHVPQNPLHFCIKEESEEERSRSVLKVNERVIFLYFLPREDFA